MCNTLLVLSKDPNNVPDTAIPLKYSVAYSMTMCFPSTLPLLACQQSANGLAYRCTNMWLIGSLRDLPLAAVAQVGQQMESETAALRMTSLYHNPLFMLTIHFVLNCNKNYICSFISVFPNLFCLLL